MPDLLTAEQVAKMIGRCERWVRDHAAGRLEPKLPAVYIGKSPRFLEAQIREWLAAGGGRC